MSKLATDLIDSLDARVASILEACTACGACVGVCPTPKIIGLGSEQEETIASGVVNILNTGTGPAAAEAWSAACCGSGHCLNVCEHGINPRFMLTMARRAMVANTPESHRRDTGKAAFQAMSRSVQLISRLQLPPDLMERLSPSSHPARETACDVIFYTGCNMLKTPHIGLICLDILDRLGISFEVYGGPSNCCGILQLRPGDEANAVRQAAHTMRRFTETGASEVLSWCPTCEIQFGETLIPTAAHPAMAIRMFPNFLADHLEDLKPFLTQPVAKTVALHEHPGSPGVVDSVVKLLTAIPGLKLVNLNQPGIGYHTSSLKVLPDFQKQYIADTLRAAEAAGISTLAGIYHADHRELVSHENQWPFEVVNYMDLIAECMGIDRPDMFKRLKLMQDVDAIVAETMEMIATYDMDLASVRDAVLRYLLGDQILPIERARHPAPGSHMSHGAQ